MHVVISKVEFYPWKTVQLFFICRNGLWSKFYSSSGKACAWEHSTCNVHYKTRFCNIHRIYEQETKLFAFKYVWPGEEGLQFNVFLLNSWSHCHVSEQKQQSPLLTATQNEIKALQLWVTETDVWSTSQVFTSYLIIPKCWSFHHWTITFLQWTERRWLNFSPFLPNIH